MNRSLSAIENHPRKTLAIIPLVGGILGLLILSGVLGGVFHQQIGMGLNRSFILGGHSFKVWQPITGGVGLFVFITLSAGVLGITIYSIYKKVTNRELSTPATSDEESSSVPQTSDDDDASFSIPHTGYEINLRSSAENKKSTTSDRQDSNLFPKTGYEVY